MRKLLSTLLALVMLMSIATGALAADGVFTGTANGMMGPITVNVTVENDVITKVEVVSHGETPGISDPAITGIPEAIVNANSVEVDAVAGVEAPSLAAPNFFASLGQRFNCPFTKSWLSEYIFA